MKLLALKKEADASFFNARTFTGDHLGCRMNDAAITAGVVGAADVQGVTVLFVFPG